MNVLRPVLVTLGRCALRLRYRISVHGLEQVAAQGTRGILFLPNHPALIDPAIVISELDRRFAPFSLADKDHIELPVFGWVAHQCGALPIPDLGRYGEAGRLEVERVLQTCAQVLQAGGNLVLYPGGRLAGGRLEELGANSAVETILKLAPRTRVVAIRTRGLWGSRFSRIQGQPDFLNGLGSGIRNLLANFVFFSPRRGVSVTLAESQAFPRQEGREAMNRWLEVFYNEQAPAALHVPRTLWERGGPRPLPEPGRIQRTGTPQEVPAVVREQVLAQLERMTGRSGIEDSMELARSLGMDSLMQLELQLWIQQEFAQPVPNAQALHTVADVLLAACGKAGALQGAPLNHIPAPWFAASGLPIMVPEGQTLPEVFLAQAARQPGRVAVADQIAGVKTYRELITTLFALRPIIQALEGPYVGIMLPASGTAAALFLAVSCAGKIPVMVNWSTGMKNMAHGLDLLDVNWILTSNQLIAKLQTQGLDLAPLRNRLLALETIGASLSRSAKFAAWRKSHLSWRDLRQPVAETAVVLFTSGSENLPKAVPLTHANILANVRDFIQVQPFSQEERFLGFLPPFHSFGLTCTMLLPLCAGMKAVFHPIPTDGEVLAQHIEAYGATMLVGTPTFLNGIVRAAQDAHLKSLRMVITGAEQCPEPLVTTILRRWPHLRVREGYGITECSPVVSFCREQDARRGTVGQPLPSLTVAVVDLERQERVAPGNIGMLLLRGPSVFGGYLRFAGQTPFVAFEGELWYRTGDLVKEDGQGHLIFCGRLQRFVKMGGEMVSLPAVEAALQARFARPEDEEMTLALEAREGEDQVELVLFTTRPITREAANAAIRAAGFSPIHNVRIVRNLEKIPVLGTGKTDYRTLKGLLAAVAED